MPRSSMTSDYTLKLRICHVVFVHQCISVKCNDFYLAYNTLNTGQCSLERPVECKNSRFDYFHWRHWSALFVRWYTASIFLTVS